MPRARLGSGTWRFESDLLDTIRAKIARNRPTLAAVYGAPLYGIKTGLNDAFVLTRKERDGIVAKGRQKPSDRSADLLRPFLVGENFKRWHVESNDLWLVYTPKNSIDIDDYPALRDHLMPFRERLEARATKQNWWELQQAQVSYVRAFQAPKIVYSDITNVGTFSLDTSAYYLANTAYFIPCSNIGMVAYLNSKVVWFLLSGLTNIARGGYLRLRTDFVSQLPLPDEKALSKLDACSLELSSLTETLVKLRVAVARRLADIDPRASTINNWTSLSFADFRSTLLKRFKITLPIIERDEWEQWFDGKRAEEAVLRRRSAEAEAEINAKVYRMFELTPTEIAAIEDTLAITSPALTLAGYEAISAVEGLTLSKAARGRLAAA